MLRTNLALAVVLMLWTPFDAHATCKQVKAESDILRIRIADEASSARILGPPRELSSEQDKTANGAEPPGK